MRRTRRAAIGLAAVCALTLAACGSDDDSGADPTDAPSDTDVSETTSPPDTEPDDTEPDTPETTEPESGATPGFPECADLDGAVVGYSQPIPDPNFALIDAVMTEQLGVVGTEYIGVNAQLDPGKQVADIQTLQQQGIDVLVINPVDPTVTANVLQEVIAAGIPVVVQDTPNDDGDYYTAVTADVENAAAEGAAILKELVGDGKVAAIVGPPFATVLIREAEAFAAAAAEVGLNLVETQTATNPGDPGMGRNIAEAWKQQHPGLAGIWTFNDTTASGVAATFDDSFAPALVSINGQPEAIPLIEAGRINATFDLQQDMIARALAFSAASAICGEELPQEIWIQSLLLDADNVGDWVNPGERGVDSGLELTEIDGRTYLVQS